MSEPLFYTRCPAAALSEGVPEVATYEVHQIWGLVAWPQPCPDCDGTGAKTGELCSCDGGKIWPQGWSRMLTIGDGMVRPSLVISLEEAVPLEKP